VNCERFTDRLYDDDCRKTLTTNAQAPPDLRDHLASCSDCRAAWDAAADDLHILRGALVEAPPSALERRLRIAVAARTAEPAGALCVPRVGSLAQAAAIGALAALAAAQTLPPALATMGQALLCLTGASVGFAGRAIYDAVNGQAVW
jgi:predicted anti-sigma-YlaC factor YlaD